MSGINQNDKLLVKKSDNIHTGTQIVYSDEIYIQNLNRNDIVNINDNCNNCKKKKLPRWINRIKKLKKNWTLKKCFLLGAMFILVEVVLMSVQCMIYKPNHDQEVHYISDWKINNSRYNLHEFIRRFNDSGYLKDNKCKYQCPKIKSKIKFVLTVSILKDCLNYRLFFPPDICINIIGKYIHGFSNDSVVSLNDIYYNYLIPGKLRAIYEGRPLTCPFDEPFFAEDLSSTIIIGMQFCYPVTTPKDTEFQVLNTDLILNLVTNLKDHNILENEDYVLEFPDICEGTPLLKRIILTFGINHISFYKNDVLDKFNSSSRLGKEVFWKFLFLGDNMTESDAIEDSLVKFPVLLNSSLNNHNNYPLKQVESVTVRYYFIRFSKNDNFPQNMWKSDEIFLNKCRSFIWMKLGKESLLLNESIGNYYTYGGSNIVYGEIPSNYLRNLESGRQDLNIFIVDFKDDIFFMAQNYEKDIISLSKSLLAINKDLRKRINFFKVNFQVACSSEIFTHISSNKYLFLYDDLVDVSYASYRKLGRYRILDSCPVSTKLIASQPQEDIFYSHFDSFL